MDTQLRRVVFLWLTVHISANLTSPSFHVRHSDSSSTGGEEGSSLSHARPKLDHSTLDLDEEGRSRPRTADGDGDRHTCSWHCVCDDADPIVVEQSEHVFLNARRSRRFINPFLSDSHKTGHSLSLDVACVKKECPKCSTSERFSRVYVHVYDKYSHPKENAFLSPMPATSLLLLSRATCVAASCTRGNSRWDGDMIRNEIGKSESRKVLGIGKYTK